MTADLHAPGRTGHTGRPRALPDREVSEMTNADERVNERLTPTPRLIIALGRPGAGRGACCVQAPARVLRMWAVLDAANDELHQVPLTPAALRRLQRSIQAIRTELERSVSAPLADELCKLLPRQAAAPSVDDLRIDCASLLGWTGGLAAGILEQVQAAAVASASPDIAGGRPVGALRAGAPPA